MNSSEMIAGGVPDRERVTYQHLIRKQHVHLRLLLLQYRQPCAVYAYMCIHPTKTVLMQFTPKLAIATVHVHLHIRVYYMYFIYVDIIIVLFSDAK